MVNDVKWKAKARKQLQKLDPQAAARIVKATRELEGMPDVANVKALKNHQYGYRLRVGDYRVLFDWEGGVAKIVMIEEVAIRNESTY